MADEPLPSSTEAAKQALEAAGMSAADAEWDDQGNLVSPEPGSPDNPNAQVPELPAQEPAPPVEVPPSTASDPDPASPEPAPEPSPASDDYPEVYWGIPKGDTPDDKWHEYVDAMRQRDQTIQDVQRKNAELERSREVKPEPAPEPEPEGPDWTNADFQTEVMVHLGYDPKDELFDIKKETVIPMAKRQFEMEQKFQEQEYMAEAEQELARWDSTIENMSKEFGPLGMEFEDVLKYAVDKGINDPESAYLRIQAEGRRGFSAAQKAAETAAAAKAAEAARKRDAASTRPGGTGPTEPPELPADASIEDMVAAAEKKLGFTTKEALDTAR